MWKSKTVWAGLLGALGAISAWATGEATLAQMLQVVVTSVLAIFLRHGVQKTQDAAEDAAEAAADAASVVTAPKKKVIKKAI
jgi:hypothetical protein|tara:strand:+ start:658 stop:903 length:246 start_codon:yes stop_codon:yes gene_type:complete